MSLPLSVHLTALPSARGKKSYMVRHMRCFFQPCTLASSAPRSTQHLFTPRYACTVPSIAKAVQVNADTEGSDHRAKPATEWQVHPTTSCRSWTLDRGVAWPTSAEKRLPALNRSWVSPVRVLAATTCPLCLLSEAPYPNTCWVHLVLVRLSPLGETTQELAATQDHS